MSYPEGVVLRREATCSCGNLKVLCHGEPELVSLCHCLACQKRTGSAYGIAAFFHKTNVQVLGPYKTYHRQSDTGFGLAFHFCGDCGSTVFWEPSRKPDMVAVGAGSFGDPHFPGPTQEVHTESRHAWVSALRPQE
uniref:GFA family protein n=1 Tax=Roseovarius indicus TaxID=540747 RepID=UPI003B51AA4A